MHRPEDTGARGCWPPGPTTPTLSASGSNPLSGLHFKVQLALSTYSSAWARDPGLASQSQ